MIFQKYKIVLSNKVEIPIDEDEVEKVVMGIKTGSVVRVRQGIFNPSFFVAMVVDEQRKERWLNDNQYRNNQPSEDRELKQLPDVFKEIKQLSTGMRMPRADARQLE